MAINGAIDYSSVKSDGIVKKRLEEALEIIVTLNNLLNEETLISDVGSFQNLSTKLSSLKDELTDIGNQLDNNVTAAERCSTLIVEGNWSIVA